MNIFNKKISASSIIMNVLQLCSIFFSAAGSSNTNKSPLPQRISSTQNTSEDSVNATLIYSASGIYSGNDATKDDTAETDERSSQAVKSKRGGKTFFKKKDKILKRNVGSIEAHGFISSFNELTSNNLPVITSARTTMPKSLNGKKYERDNHGINDDTNKLFDEQILCKKNAKCDPNKYSKQTFKYFLHNSHCGICEKREKCSYLSINIIIIDIRANT